MASDILNFKTYSYLATQGCSEHGLFHVCKVNVGLSSNFIYIHVSNQSKDDSVLNLHGVGPIFTLINLTDNWLKEYFLYMQLSAVSSCSH